MVKQGKFDLSKIAFDEHEVYLIVYASLRGLEFLIQERKEQLEMLSKYNDKFSVIHKDTLNKSIEQAERLCYFLKEDWLSELQDNDD